MHGFDKCAAIANFEKYELAFVVLSGSENETGRPRLVRLKRPERFLALDWARPNRTIVEVMLGLWLLGILSIATNGKVERTLGRRS
jgi:hypothetical protein